jgi:PAS domain S-box-containing protein
MSYNTLPPDYRELAIDPDKSIVFKFSSDLKLEFVNDYFTEFTGYEIHDVVGTTVEEMGRPDMPKLISEMIHNHVNNKKNINLILRNITKNGQFYWFMTDFKFDIDKQGQLRSFIYYRKAPPKAGIPTLEKLYKKLVDIENHASIAIAKKYLDGLLEEKNMSFAEYTASLATEESFNSIINQSIPTKKKSFFGKLLGK